ncbi:ribonuclease D [Bowmanella dokdonensis]|uniref:Ribonuclease D n=1 Tax=Bowmanella dokdonensis TaxID=751969 RepID=A0A939DM60_9ALTE|nr:ribonuclease D [Bowmanella dokdonensis]MBN7825023.1 ribonuclease D [Bowmanella dokdonensis]
MTYTIINHRQALQAFCEQAGQKEFIAVDTEFVRTRTLYPQLGLIQLYDGEALVLVDPLAMDDLSPLKALLTDPKVVKVLHSCSEDLETFWTAMQVIPAPLFDTQFAAGLLNMGPSLGYAKLVEEMLSVSLDKGESRTDWLSRPLSEQQLSYAANDVLYLYRLYPMIAEAIDKLERRQWVFDEMAQLALKKRTDLAPDQAYLTIKNNWQLRGRALATLKYLAKWRLEKARENNVALNFVFKEQYLVELARRQPMQKNAFYGINGMPPQDVRRHGDELLEIIKRCHELPPEHYPDKVERLVDFPAYKQVSQAIRQHCEEVSTQLQIPVEMLGSKKQINQLLKWLWFELDEGRLTGLRPDLICTWREPLLKAGISKIVGVSLS